MVFFNYATMQMAAKIVYYGPGLCGKTTNLHHIYAKTSPQSRGEMVSLETETDRTLFFDLLPIDVGVIGGFKTRLQLYTIPGQVFYNTTRKLVLKGVDGLVFVADSQKAMLDANLESFKNLRENLAEIGLTVEELPLVVQLNKRDLPNIADPNTILDVLDPDRRYESVEAVAAKGDGVFETLKLISKLTLRTLRRRMTGEEPAKPAGRRDTGTFRVQQNEAAPPQRNATAPIPAFGGTTAPVASSPAFTTPAATASVAAAPAAAPIVKPPPIIEETIEELESSEMIAEAPRAESFSDSTLAKTADVDAHILTSAPVAAPPAPPESAAQEPPPAQEPIAAVPEPEINFSQTEKPAKAAPDVKHVKVRSSVDVMAELEALRKRATTQTPQKPAKKEASVLDLLAQQQQASAPKTKRDLRKSMTMAVAPDVLPRSRRVRVTVSFEGDEGVVQTQDQFVDLAEGADIGSIVVDLKLET
jgi:signal recognition particle receptor subunit beta